MSAQETADNIIGVWFVRNYIKVRPVKMTDRDIEQRIKASLINDPVIESYEIDPVVNNGKVTLKGQVDNYYEKIQADQRVSEIRGVVSVKNNLIVKDSYDVLVADPYLEDMWYSYSYDWYTYPGFTATRKTDWQIKQDIQDEIWWSPFVDSSDVAVYVDDGVATLTGKVDTWSEWFAARDNAYEGGAVMVRNRLGLEYGPEEEAMD
jgi:osmotically-inducible protein OsmY